MPKAQTDCDGVALRAAALGVCFGISSSVLCLKRSWILYPLHNLALLAIFHFLEYYITAKTKPDTVTLDGKLNNIDRR